MADAPRDGIDGLIRPDLADFVGYSASTNPETLEEKIETPVDEIIKLDANENPYGCSPRVQPALAAYAEYSIYPDAEQTELRRRLAGYTGVGAEHIVASSGSDQLIDNILRLLIRPGDEVINCVPTFAMFHFFTKLCGGISVDVPRDEEFAIDVARVKSAITGRTKVIFLANPNNPTGTITPKDDILEIIDTGLPVVVDEAYYEFTGQTMAQLVGQRQNVLVLRTFSKWAGLAGLRIGYGLFPANIAGYLLKIKSPYSVNVAAIVAAKESLADIDYLKNTVKAVIDERERLFQELGELGFLKPFPSQANFIYCAVLKGKANEITQRLQDRGILVRYFDQPLLKNAIRISVGRPEHTDVLLRALREIGGD